MKAIPGELANEQGKQIPEDVASWVASPSNSVYHMIARLGYAQKEMGMLKVLDVTKVFDTDGVVLPALYVVGNERNEIEGGYVTMHGSIGKMVHKSEVERGYKVGAHLGDILYVYESKGQLMAKLLTDDECKEMEDGTFYHGLMTSHDKKNIEDAKNYYPTFPTDGDTSFDNCLHSGCYPYVWKNNDSADAPTYNKNIQGRIDLFVTRSTTADADGYYAVVQTAVGRDVDVAGKVWTRQMFVREDGSKAICDWSIGSGGGLTPEQAQELERLSSTIKSTEQGVYIDNDLGVHTLSCDGIKVQGENIGAYTGGTKLSFTGAGMLSVGKCFVSKAVYVELVSDLVPSGGIQVNIMIGDTPHSVTLASTGSVAGSREVQLGVYEVGIQNTTPKPIEVKVYVR